MEDIINNIHKFVKSPIDAAVLGLVCRSSYRTYVSVLHKMRRELSDVYVSKLGVIEQSIDAISGRSHIHTASSIMCLNNMLNAPFCEICQLELHSNCRCRDVDFNYHDPLHVDKDVENAQCQAYFAQFA